MSEKLVITKEQHDAVIKALGNRKGDRAQLIGDHSVMRGVKEHGVLNELTVSDMARIVYEDNFELEKSAFKNGDLLIRKNGERFESGSFVDQFYFYDEKVSYVVLLTGWRVPAEEVRLADEEEIFWMYELNRDKPGDFREGDVIITQEVSYRYSTDGEVDTIGPHTTQLWLDEGIIKGIYPAEAFKPLKKEQPK